ncbi:hypothetical protein M3Y99_00840700 [Aphelenchoides fujianensis]|nr:hypothetical protein M3Y99_00840700 [Aphelenchoides fujianensis]
MVRNRERPLTRRYCAKWREPELPPAGHCKIFRSSFGSEQICLCTRDLCNGQNIAIGTSTFDSPVIQTQPSCKREIGTRALFNFHAALTQAFRQKFEEELAKHGH